MKQLSVLVFFLCANVGVNAAEFLYPVAIDKNGSLYLIYQKTANHIELWEWDPQTKQADQLLFSRFTPAGFRLLPMGDGFSFVDNGILKVKKFVKRSPRTIEFDAPIYQVEIVQWIDNNTCYTSGKYKENFGIFQIDYEGEVNPVYLRECIDCMYPQKINDCLWYIERDERGYYRVMQTSYLPSIGNTFNERISWHQEHLPNSESIASFEKQPIAFLSMISLSEGFVIGHPPLVSRTEHIIPFDYYHLKKDEGVWQVTHLFSFYIPSDLLFIGKSSRLYESLLPLLPQHIGQKIVFSSMDDFGILSLFAYDTASKINILLPDTQNLFPPVRNKCGGLLGDKVVMGVGRRGGVRVGLVELQV